MKGVDIGRCKYGMSQLRGDAFEDERGNTLRPESPFTFLFRFFFSMLMKVYKVHLP